jgi:alpha-amylase
LPRAIARRFAPAVAALLSPLLEAAAIVTSPIVAASRWASRPFDRKAERGDPPVARAALGRAQCNDAYWHGVFGGLYLPHLRAAIWANLASAERELRRGEPLRVEQLDIDCDGALEIWIHSASFSALVSPRRGGVIEEFTLFESGVNYADVLTRRREAYHEPPPPAAPSGHGGEGTPSIHDLEQLSRLDRLPPTDPVNRALFVDRVLARDVTLEAYQSGAFPALASWSDQFAVTIDTSNDSVELVLRAGGLDKRIRLTPTGGLTVSYRWDAAAFPSDAVFCPEISVARELTLDLNPQPADVWSFPFATMSRSERGFEETVQGRSYTPRWAIRAGEAQVTARP